MRNIFSTSKFDFRSKNFKTWMIFLVIGVSILTVVVLVWKINTLMLSMPPSSTDPYSMPSGNISVVFDIFGKLIIVVGLIYLLFSIYRMFQNKSAKTQKHLLSIQETLRLSPRQSIFIIRAGGKKYLVGATEQTMTLLAQLDEETLSTNEPVNLENKIPFMEEEQEFNSVLQKSINKTLDVFKPSANT